MSKLSNSLKEKLLESKVLSNNQKKLEFTQAFFIPLVKNKIKKSTHNICVRYWGISNEEFIFSLVLMGDELASEFSSN